MAKLFDKVSGDFLNSIKSVMEKTLTSAEMKKREEVAKAIERDNPSMPMSKKMAIATSTAKKVAEAKLDPVNHKELEGTHAQRKDKDINNDGKVDSTDKYLHTRRKAVKHAIAKRMKEEAEQIDEISKKLAVKTYAKRAADAFDKDDYKIGSADREYDKRDKTGERIKKKFGKKTLHKAFGAAHREIFGEEAEQIDEISAGMKSRYKQKAQRSLDQAQDFKSELDYEGEPRGSRVRKDVNRIIKNRKTGMKRANEEAEQIDEISTKTALNYMDKASDARGHRNMSTPKLDKRYKSMALAHEKIRARHAKVPTTEEVEELEELSKKTMGSYVNKAAYKIGDQGITAGLKIQNNEPAGKNLKKMGNRQKGIERAVDRLTKEEIALTPEEIEMIEAKMAGVADGALPGDEHMCATKVFHKEWNEGVPVPTMHADPDEDGLIEWYDVMFDHGIERVMTEDMEILDERSHGHKRMKEEISVIQRSDGTPVLNCGCGKDPCVTYGMKQEEVELDEMSSKMKMKLGLYGKKKKMKEEAEDLDESAKVAAHLIKRYGDNVRKSHVRSAANDFGVGYVALSHAVRKKLGVNRLEEEQVDEARGRPKKTGQKDFTVHPVTKEKMMHNNPEHMKRIEKLQKTGMLEKPKREAAQHIMNQLSKAKTSMRGGETIHFTHGESKHVSGSHAAKLITKYQSMKPSEKEDFQKKIGHSHEQLMKHV